jgi:single-stranded DNA-binding protein
MNSISGIVKILENPKQKFTKNNNLVTKLRVQFPQFRKTQIVKLVFWGNLAKDVTNYYKKNDYLLIEGYLSLVNSQSSNKTAKTSKQIQITVLKVYPFLLGYSRTQ